MIRLFEKKKLHETLASMGIPMNRRGLVAICLLLAAHPIHAADYNHDTYKTTDKKTGKQKSAKLNKKIGYYVAISVFIVIGGGLLYYWDTNANNGKNGEKPHKDKKKSNLEKPSDDDGDGPPQMTYGAFDKMDANALVNWIKKLPGNKKDRKLMIDLVLEQKLSGVDILSLESVEDVQDSFTGVSLEFCVTVFKALPKQSDKVFEPLPKKPGKVEEKLKFDEKLFMSKYRVIGLVNLKNTCFLNTIIQAILNTPGVIQDIITAADHFPKANSMTYKTLCQKHISAHDDMLSAMGDLARRVMKSNSRYISPKRVVALMRNADVKFEDGEQGDALSAVGKMIELIDKELIHRYAEKNPIHPGSWHVPGEPDKITEAESIKNNMRQYNPNKASAIREKMYFVERNILKSTKDNGATATESRYDLKPSILLPLDDHSVNLNVTIFGLDNNTVKLDNNTVKNYALDNVMNYAGIKTLKHLLFSKISDTDKEALGVKTVDDIVFGCVRYEKTGALKEVVFNLEDVSGVDKGAGINEWVVSLRDTSVKEGEMKIKEYYTNQDVRIFAYKKPNNPIQKINNEFIDFENLDANKLAEWVASFNVDAKYKEEIKNVKLEILDGQMTGYAFLSGIKEEEHLRDSFSSEMSKEPFDIFYKEIQRMRLVNNIVKKTEEAAKKQKKISYKPTQPSTLESGIGTYISTKVLDRGGGFTYKLNGKKTVVPVFTNETTIVRYSEILTSVIDRYNSGEKFEKTVKYKEFMRYGEHDYELYAVSNHSGDLVKYGHYWAFIKCVTDNRWYNANDTSITPINNLKEVLDKASAIILMYKRVKKK